MLLEFRTASYVGSFVLEQCGGFYTDTVEIDFILLYGYGCGAFILLYGHCNFLRVRMLTLRIFV